MSETDDPQTGTELAAALAGIAALSGETALPRRMGGLTNRVFQVGTHVLRLPGHGTEGYIDRHNEAAAARAAAQAGVAPDLIHVAPETGIMVTRFIPDAITMSPDAFRERRNSPARAGAILARLHASGAVFPARFELFSMIDEYLGHLDGRPVALPEGYHATLAEAEAVRHALAAHPVPLAPCHCDPLCENFLDDGARMWVVDWEYSGMNDPMWDLGDLSVEADLSTEDEAALMEAYFGHPPDAFDMGRMVIYKAMCDLLWTLWGLLQVANKNPADDFQTYAETRFRRCRSLMATPDFTRHLNAVAAGPRK